VSIDPHPIDRVIGDQSSIISSAPKPKQAVRHPICKPITDN